MNAQTKKLTGVVGLTAGLALTIMVLFASTPFGTFLQSSLFGGLYAAKDPGLYTAREEQTSTGKVLKADQGVTLRAEPVQSGSTYQMNVYLSSLIKDANLDADSLRAIVTYDASQLSVANASTDIAPVATNASVDTSFTQVLKNAQGGELGILYLGLDKASNFVEPSEELLRVRFTAKQSTPSSAEAKLIAVKLYKRDNITDATKPTLFLTENEGDYTVAEKVSVVYQGNTVQVTENLVAGQRIRTENYKNASGATTKTIELTYDGMGRLLKQVTTIVGGDTETRVYTYKDDGSFTEQITAVKQNGATTSTTLAYDKNKNLMQNTPGTTQVVAVSTGTVLPTATKDTTIKTVTTGVTSAVTNTTTTAGSTVTSQNATTTGNTPCTPSSAERFNDTVGHWSETVVEQARQKCIISGKSLGRFAPDEPVTRAELTKIAVEAFKVSQASGSVGFADVSDTEWYASYIRAAKAAAIVGGYNDGTFKPNNQVNRAEALKIILEAGVKTNASKLSVNLDSVFGAWLNQNPTYTYVRFPDVKVADWFGKYVYTGSERGVVKGYNDRGVDVFRPAQPVTRAEAVKMIMSIVQ
ncbi:hypothetical protein COW46_04925 [Candidatus Gracilibacteria bacterium CG17_big_fil_post_rev_8_21_14_2_50_48_13]|nr:MAG: hypothetical protein COW46_04925 [Candidatus Gracilibacteria bacterium CG17_big_fil_post_rev_8_21_14_2_50_48_13]